MECAGCTITTGSSTIRWSKIFRIGFLGGIGRVSRPELHLPGQRRLNGGRRWWWRGIFSGCGRGPWPVWRCGGLVLARPAADAVVARPLVGQPELHRGEVELLDTRQPGRSGRGQPPLAAVARLKSHDVFQHDRGRRLAHLREQRAKVQEGRRAGVVLVDMLVDQARALPRVGLARRREHPQRRVKRVEILQRESLDRLLGRPGVVRVVVRVDLTSLARQNEG